MISSKINELYHIGSLLYITTNVSCLAIDTEKHSLAEIPENHVEQCFCQRLAKRLGINIGYNHIYKKCNAITNVNKQIIYECPFGLSNIIVPVFENEKLIAALQAGPILTMEPEEYMKTKILPLWKLKEKDQKELIKELKNYPQGDISYVIALSEMLSTLITKSLDPNPNAPEEITSSMVGSDKKTDRISSIIEFIASNYADDITLTDAAKYAYINPSHLSREFNKKMNCNFRSYLNNIRIEKAKELLIHSDLSLAEIGSQVGFADQSYFNKIFRKQEGLTPGQYRTLNNNLKHYPMAHTPNKEDTEE